MSQEGEEMLEEHLSAEQQDELLKQWRSGGSPRSVARNLKVPLQQVLRYLAATGAVHQAVRGQSGWHLSVLEREEISRGLDAGASYRLIAANLGRPHTTISREVARNGGREAYRAVLANEVASERRRRPRSTKHK